jgi:hypothetical protein
MISRECFQIGGHRWNESWLGVLPWRNCFEEPVSASPVASLAHETRWKRDASMSIPRLIRVRVRRYAAMLDVNSMQFRN